MEEIKVTVVMPIYNVRPWMERAVDSVLGQTYRNIEVLLVDDGSTDGCGELCDRYAGQDPRVRVIHQANRGLSSVRNVGISQAAGDFLCFVDGDDYIELDTLEMQVNNIRKYGAEIACCGFYLETEDGKKTPQDGTESVLVCTGAEGKEHLLKGHFAFPSMCNKLYARRLFPYMKNDETIRYTEDYLANYFTLPQARCIVVEDRCKYHYVQRRGSYVLAKLNEGQFDALRVSEIVMEGEKDHPELLPYCTRRRLVIVLSLVNRIIKSGSFRERRASLEQEFLRHKKEILTSGLYGRKERFAARLMALSPALYGAVVRMKFRLTKM